MIRKNIFTRLIVGSCLSLLVFLGVGLDRYHEMSRYVFAIDMQSSVPGTVQLFFDIGNDFNETDSVRLPLKRSTSLIHYRFLLPPGTYRQLRFDPSGSGGTFVLAAASIVGPNDQTVRTFPMADFRPVQHISAANWVEDRLVITAPTGVNDPIVIIDYGPPFELRPALSGILWTLFGLFVLTWAASLAIVMAAGELLGLLGGGRRRLVQTWTWVLGRPTTTIILVGVVAAVASCYPVVFLGRSFVSPNNGATSLLYEHPPYLPGDENITIESVRASDVGAMMWAFMPYSVVQHRAIFDHAESPLWNRYNSAGLPLLGQGQSMIGDPLHLIPVFAGGSAGSWDVKFVLAKVLFAVGIGLLVFAATQFLPAALLLAASSVFIGFFAYRFNHPAFFSVCYAPWVLYSWLQVLRAPTRRQQSQWMVGLLIASWMLINSGTVKEAYILLVLLHLTGFIAFLLHRRPMSDKIKLGAALSSLGVVFVLISSPFWLNFLELLKNSFTVYNVPSVQPAPIRLFAGFFDSILYERVLGYVAYPPANLLVFLGIVFAAARIKDLYRDAFFVASALGSILAFALAFGVAPPWVITRIPFLANIHHTGNTFSSVLLILAFVLAGFGIREFWRQCTERGWQSDFTIPLVLIVSIIGISYLSNPTLAAVPGLSSMSGMISSLLLIAAVALPLGARRMIASQTVTPVAAFLVLASLFVIHVRHGMQLETGIARLDHYIVNPQPRVDFAVASPAVDSLPPPASEPYRVVGVGGTMFPGFNGTLGIEGINGPDALLNPHYRELIDAFGFKREWGWLTLVQADDLERLAPALDLLNVRYVLAPLYTPSLPAALRHVAQNDLKVLERTTVWPRAFFTDTVVAYQDPSDFGDLVAESHGRPFAAIQAGGPVRGLSVQSLATSRSTSTIVPASDYRLTSNRTSFTITAPGAGVVVLTEAFVAGDFEVAINGRPADYFRVNHAFKGVKIDGAGTYTISFTYKPKFWSLSLWLLGGGVAALVGLLFLNGFRLSTVRSSRLGSIISKPRSNQ